MALSRQLMRPVAVALTLALSGVSVPATALAQTPLESDEVTFFKTEDDYRSAAPEAEAAPRIGVSTLEAESGIWKRLAGADRYGTMQAISTEGFTSSTWAVLACDHTYPDALAASSLAGALSCPILLAGAYGVPTETLSELSRLGVTNAYVVGGEASVGEGAVAQLTSAGIEVERVGGADRQETSLMVARELRELQDSGQTSVSSDVVCVTTGSDFADALSIAPFAYATASPILLTNGPGMLSDAEAAFLASDARYQRALVISSGTVSTSIDSQLAGRTIERIDGANRYQTSRSVAEWETKHGFTLDGVLVACGTTYPDALTASALAGSKRAALVLGENLYQPTFGLLRENAASISGGYLIGGTASLPIDDPLTPVDDDPMTLKAQSYSSATDWLIMIDCVGNRCGIYHGSQDNWVCYDRYKITTGKLTTPTVRGVFSTYDKGYSFDGDVYTCYYYTAFYGSYLMHSIIYAKHTFNVLDGQLGTNGSMGCVRMPIEWAKWVYENIPLNTTVVTFG